VGQNVPDGAERGANETGDGGFLRSVFNAIPVPLFVIDRDLAIHDLNRAAVVWTGRGESVIRQRLCGDVLRCANPGAFGEPCGETEACPNCVIRTAVQRAVRGEATLQCRTTMMVTREGSARQPVTLLVSATPFESNGRDYALVVLEDVTELTDLRRLLPVCANCRKVRTDDQLWESVEAYLAKHTNIDMTHGLCPDCRAALYPELSD